MTINMTGGNFVAEGPRLLWIVWSCGLIGLGFFICLLAIRLLNNHRYLCVLVLATGCLLAGLGYALWLPPSASVWRWTWGTVLHERQTEYEQCPQHDGGTLPQQASTAREAL
jgi:hypothetical protein